MVNETEWLRDSFDDYYDGENMPDQNVTVRISKGVQDELLRRYGDDNHASSIVAHLNDWARGKRAERDLVQEHEKRLQVLEVQLVKLKGEKS